LGGACLPVGKAGRYKQVKDFICFIEQQGMENIISIGCLKTNGKEVYLYNTIKPAAI
jgi:hypothetical protein